MNTLTAFNVTSSQVRTLRHTLNAYMDNGLSPRAFLVLRHDGTVDLDAIASGTSLPGNYTNHLDIAVQVSSYSHVAHLTHFINSEAVAKLLSRIYAGHDIQSTGREHVGFLTRDANKALLLLDFNSQMATFHWASMKIRALSASSEFTLVAA